MAIKGEAKPRILVAETESDFIETARKAFKDFSEVTFASNLKTALDRATVEKPDIIIIGYLEPRGTSFELHRKLREGELTQDIPLMVVDVRPEEHSRKGWKREEGMLMEAEDYISRPVEPADLKETVEAVLRRDSSKPMELAEVAEQMEVILKRINKIEEMLVN
ncbi:PleD family two-component system response regulator [Chloroflexota bacterium]